MLKGQNYLRPIFLSMIKLQLRYRWIASGIFESGFFKIHLRTLLKINRQP